MALRKCEKVGCRSRNSHGLWLVDGRRMCQNCMDRFFETNFLDEHRVYRLSDREKDFPERLSDAFSDQAGA